MNKVSGLSDDQIVARLSLVGNMSEQQTGLRGNKGNFPLSNWSVRQQKHVPMPPGGGIAPF